MKHDTAAYLLLLLVQRVYATQTAFSVNDDVFAYPQYEVSISPEFLPESYAVEMLKEAREETDGDAPGLQARGKHSHQSMLLHGRPFLCSIPHVIEIHNETEERRSAEEEKKELVRAADRGWELLKEMEGKQCLFYTTGWWSYMFCYKSHVKQFHSLPASSVGPRAWPPQEDLTTPSYVLGRYDTKSTKKPWPNSQGIGNIDTLQRKAESSYLVQKMRGGTPCDLTGEERTIEVQFHCNPQSTDRIGWIKEVATCAYLMVVYTPRLCNDVAFQPPKGTSAQMITCQQVVAEGETASLEQVRQQQSVEGLAGQRVMVGDIEVGAMKVVGKDGKKLERGRIVMTAAEKAEVVMMQKDGQIQGLSKAELKKLNLNPETVEAFRKELQEIAGEKDWKIERLGENGQVQLRGTVAEDNTPVAQDDEPSEDGGTEEHKKAK